MLPADQATRAVTAADEVHAVPIYLSLSLSHTVFLVPSTEKGQGTRFETGSLVPSCHMIDELAKKERVSRDREKEKKGWVKERLRPPTRAVRKKTALCCQPMSATRSRWPSTEVRIYRDPPWCFGKKRLARLMGGTNHAVRFRVSGIFFFCAVPCNSR